MPRLDVHLVAFDLGGTTLQDRGDVGAALKRALADHEVELAPTELDDLRGRSKRDAIRRVLLARSSDQPSAALERRAEAVHAAFETHLLDRLRSAAPVPGARATFDWLQKRGIKIALMTGFERRLTAAILERLGWHEGVLDAVVCADDVAVGRPAPYLLFRAMEVARALRVRQVMAVGDTEADLLAAANGGIGYPVGVLSGAHSRERLARRPHLTLLPSVADLPDLWEAAGRLSRRRRSS